MLPARSGVLETMPEDSGSLQKSGKKAPLEPFFENTFLKQIKGKLSEEINPILPHGREIRELFNRLCEPWPEWVLIAIGKYVGAFFPTLKPKEITLLILTLVRGDFDKFDDLTLSKLIGHFAAITKSLEDNPYWRAKSADETSSNLGLVEEIILKRFKHILSLPREESEKCLSAFSSAYSNTFDENGHPKGVKSNRPILWALIFRWPIIEKMSSVSALHEYLQKVLPAERVGDKKRLEAICKEHKIKFRNRGRPKKS
jgi:hypothetical protein